MSKRLIVVLISIFIVLSLLILFRRKSKEDYTTSNAKKDDKYIRLWNDEIFLPNSPEINYIVAYHYIKKYPLKKGINIILDGEPANLEKINADLIITTKKKFIPNIPSVYAPYFVWTFVEGGINPELLIKNGDVVEKSKFCCFMYSNCDESMEGVRKRRIFYEMLNKYKKVDNLGRCYNPNYKNNGGWTRNYSIYTPYKFVIAFENNVIDGYITEKLVMPMLARAIPIYLGPDASEVFNRKSYINVNDFSSFEDCIQYILKVDSDPELYDKILSEPYLHENRVDKDIFSVYYGGKFYRELYEKIPSILREYIRPCKLYVNNIRFITFADGKKFKNDRVLKEAKYSGFFKECFGFSAKDLVDFPHKKFIEKNSRGYGYWIWKPYFILKNLLELNEGDFLIYLDSGSTICVDGYKRVHDYFKILEKNPMITFRIRHEEKKWNKMSCILNCIKNLKNDKNEVIDQIFNIDSKQRTSGMILMKKCPETLALVELWYELCQDYSNIDDTKSEANHPEFIEHRHDQSIFSVLTKIFGIMSIDDNFSDERNDYIIPNGEKRPFVLSRKRV